MVTRLNFHFELLSTRPRSTQNLVLHFALHFRIRSSESCCWCDEYFLRCCWWIFVSCAISMWWESDAGQKEQCVRIWSDRIDDENITFLDILFQCQYVEIGVRIVDGQIFVPIWRKYLNNITMKWNTIWIYYGWSVLHDWWWKNWEIENAIFQWKVNRKIKNNYKVCRYVVLNV